MSGLLLDTHYWLWLQTGNSQRLNAEARETLLEAQRRGELYVSDISVLEIARLAAAGRIDLGTPVEDFVREGTRDGGLELLELTTEILIASTRLPGELHRDPSDRILVATARRHGLCLVTCDELLLRYGREGNVQAMVL